MNEECDLEGRVVLITGASRGIGLAMAKAFHSRGAKVALSARGREGLEAAADALGERAFPVEIDVARASSVTEGVERTVGHFGKLDVLVNNAAVGRLSRIADIEEEDLLAQVEINFLGAVHCIRSVVPHMRKTGGGDIVNVSSDSVERPFPYLGVYGATKAALEKLSEGLRAELAPEDIRVSLLRSGPSLTSFASQWSPDVAAAAFEEWSAGDFLDPASVMHPEAIADAAVFMVTRPREASVYTFDVRPRRVN